MSRNSQVELHTKILTPPVSHINISSLGSGFVDGKNQKKS